VSQAVDAPAPEVTGSPEEKAPRGEEPEVWHDPAESEVSRGEEAAGPEDPIATLARVIEALLFLSSDPLSLRELAEASAAEEQELSHALALLAEQYAPGRRGIRLRELAGGYTLVSDPLAEDAARRLFSSPRAATLSPAQAETLAIVAYLQPISRPEITRIRGVSADSATATLLERGLIEEAGRSQFGAVLYRTGTQFLKLFGLRSLQELPDVAQWDPTPEEQSELRERLLRAGEARSGGGPPPELGDQLADLPADGDQAADLPAGEE
jgi:segregation and condensation protein B